jgi:chemotaxis methyl-accepting protein methylase
MDGGRRTSSAVAATLAVRAGPSPYRRSSPPMLSPASYQRIRFTGRPSARASVAGQANAEPADEATLRAARTARHAEPTLGPSEQRLVAGALKSAGLDAAAYRTGPFRRRVPAVLRALRASSWEDAIELVSGDPEAAARALGALLIGHTEPFRDSDTFEQLRVDVLPGLAAGRTGLRVWSVGCSGGLELISAALLLAERGILSGSELRGSDCRAAAIAAARSGAAMRLTASLPAQFEDLRQHLAGAEFGAAIARTSWVVEDALTAEIEASAWNLVFCRNLAIYLDVQSSQRLWARLVAALAPGGVLVTGRAERPPAPLPLVRLAKSIYRLEGGTP